MADQHLRDILARGLSADDLGLPTDRFERLLANIAEAIRTALAEHEQRAHARTPEFGEEERVDGTR
jgi:hypothetical protein